MKIASEMIHVEVAYAAEVAEQVIVPVYVRKTATLGEAIKVSGMLERFPELDLAVNRVGVFGRPGSLEDLVSDGDRIELYRPLIADPKEARRRRAKGNSQKAGKKIIS
ncbi:MAG TPA: RnfH family protein [Burkholderiales bacterium]|nr:RnfH family protein [Burkholderiales bacterium]